MLRTRVRDLRAPVGRKTLGGAVSATQHGGALGVGARVLRRYRIDLVFGHGPSPTFLATRYPDGEKVLIRVLQDPLTDQRGPLLVHLVHEAKVVMEQQPNVAQILEFGIDEATGARCLVMSYDQSATAAQIADPRGPQERTAALFLEIAAALMERHEIDRHGATLDAARGTGLGRALMERAIAFCDARAYTPVTLTTFRGLDAARHLYEAFGFKLVQEDPIDRWHGGVGEQTFSRPAH